MQPKSRRDFLSLLAASVTMSGMASGVRAQSGAAPRVLVIGGGTGGCTAAKYLKIENPDLQVTVVEPYRKIFRCWGSNEVLTDVISIDEITMNHDALRDRYGIEFIYDKVLSADPVARTVRLAGGDTLSYDRAVVSIGIDFKMDAVDGYDHAAADGPIPHAYKAGEQTMRLRQQIMDMPENGTAIIVPPPNPFRCPPGPYERSSLLAEYFVQNKPRAKVLILDLKDKFTKDKPFMLGWNRLYGFNIPDTKMEGMPSDVQTFDTPGRIEWVPGASGGRVVSMDPGKMEVTIEAGETIRADVINYIPPQKAGKLAFDMDLTDGDWCPIVAETMESTRYPGIHLIGDMTIAGAMPKSGYSANTQAKIAAAQINRILTGQELIEPTWSNACFSRVSGEYGVSVAAQYRLDRDNNTIVSTPGSGGISSLDASHQVNRMEAFYQAAWMENFVGDVFK